LALSKTGREALRLEGHLDLVNQWLAEIHLADRVVDFEWPLKLVYRPIKIQRSDDGQSVVLDHELALVLNGDEDDFNFLEATGGDPDEAELGSVVYAQRWKAKRGERPEDDTQLLLFALTVGRRYATERARDLLLVLSSHLGRPPLTVAPPETPHAALETLLQALRPAVSKQDEEASGSD
jgi:hypothetical protein